MSEQKLRDSFKSAAACVPTNWCDSLLTGPDAALPHGSHEYGCADVERLLRAIKARIEQWEAEGSDN